MIWVILLTIAAYINVVQAGFVSDDKSGVMDKKGKFSLIGGLSSILDELWFKLIKNNKIGWHIIVLSYHLINIYLFYSVSKLMFGDEIAIVSASLFCIHPATNQVAVWLSGRHYAIMGWFILTSLLFSKLFAPLWILAAFTHPQGIMLPIITCFKTPSLLHIAYFLIMFAGGIYYAKLAFKRNDIFGWDRKLAVFTFKRINMFINIINYYLFVTIIPLKLGFYHAGMFAYDEKYEKFDFKIIIGGATLIIFGSLIVAFKGSAFSFGLFWFFMFLIPCMNIIHTNMLFAERYMYVPLMGYCWALSNLLVAIPNYQICLAVIMTLYFVRTFTITLSYRDENTLYISNLRNHPLSVEAHINQGDLFLAEQHRSDLALPLFSRAVELKPDHPVAHFNLGCSLYNIGDISGAEKCWEKAIELNPKYINPRYNLMRLRQEKLNNSYQMAGV
jgi:tetratricopeptide (TPR) repeat protein